MQETKNLGYLTLPSSGSSRAMSDLMSPIWMSRKYVVGYRYYNYRNM